MKNLLNFKPVYHRELVNKTEYFLEDLLVYVKKSLATVTINTAMISVEAYEKLVQSAVDGVDDITEAEKSKLLEMIESPEIGLETVLVALDIGIYERAYLINQLKGNIAEAQVELARMQRLHYMQ